MQPTLFNQPPDKPKFHGNTYVANWDEKRLTTLLGRVYTVMSDSRWRTFGEIRELLGGGSEASISARLRQQRKHNAMVQSWREEQYTLPLPPIQHAPLFFTNTSARAVLIDGARGGLLCGQLPAHQKHQQQTRAKIEIGRALLPRQRGPATAWTHQRSKTRQCRPLTTACPSLLVILAVKPRNHEQPSSDGKGAGSAQMIGGGA